MSENHNLEQSSDDNQNINEITPLEIHNPNDTNYYSVEESMKRTQNALKELDNMLDRFKLGNDQSK